MNGKLLPLARSAGTKKLYRTYQCGLCHGIGADHGFAQRLFAGPDVVFYNLFLDVCAAETARVEHRACVVAPLVTRLPSALPTDHSRLASAVGIWFGGLKLEDDWRDEGGWHKWLAWRLVRPSAEKARAVLDAAGFPIGEVERLMREQARIEAAGALSLEEAARPTVEIARLTFGFAGREAGVFDQERAGEIGARIGAFLFHLDNLDDFRQDARRGQYNALARAFGGGAEVPSAGREAAVEGAMAAIHDLRRLLAPLSTLAPEAQYLRDTLVLGFTERIQRVARGLPARPVTSLSARVHTAFWNGIVARRPLLRALARPQVAWAVMLAWAAFGKAAFAARWWPEDATPDQLGLDTADTGAPPPDPLLAPPANGFLQWGDPVDVYCCDCSNDGDFDFWDVCCVSDDCECNTACDSACDNACSDVDCCST